MFTTLVSVLYFCDHPPLPSMSSNSNSQIPPSSEKDVLYRANKLIKIQYVHYNLVGICPYVIRFVYINCWLLSVYYWVNDAHCPSVVTWISFITGYSLSIIAPYIIVFVSINCCLLSVRVLLVGLCPSIVGYCPSIIKRYPYYWTQSIIHYCWVGICPYVIGFVSTNCCLLSVSVIGLFMSIFVG